MCVTQNRSISRAGPEECDGRSLCVSHKTGQYQGQIQRGAMGGVCVCHTKQVNIKGRSRGVRWEEFVCVTQNRSISRADPEGCDGRSLCVSHKTGQYQGQIQRGAMGGVCVCHTKQVNIKGRSRGVRWEEFVCVTQNRSISRADPEGCDGRSLCVSHKTGQYQGQIQRGAMGGVCVCHTKQVNIKGRSRGVRWEEFVCVTQNRSISRADPEGCDGRSLCVSHKTGQYQGQIQRGAMGGVCVCHTKQVNIKGRSRGVRWEEFVCVTQNRSISRADPEGCDGRSLCVSHKTGQYQGQVQRSAMGGVCVSHKTGQYQGQIQRGAMGGVCVCHTKQVNIKGRSRGVPWEECVCHTKQVNIKGRSRGVRWEECVCVTQNRSISRADPEGCDGRSVCVSHKTGQYQGQIQRGAMGDVCVSYSDQC